jgi:hypothetical protein
MFIGAKMLAEPWIHIPTGISLAIVGSVIIVAIFISVIRTRITSSTRAVGATVGPAPRRFFGRVTARPSPTPEYIGRLAHQDFDQRAQVAWDLSGHGAARTLNWFDEWLKDEGFRGLVVQEQIVRPDKQNLSFPRLTTGISVLPETFDRIRAANGSPPLANVPPDQDAMEFELEFHGQFVPPPRLDILTTNAPGGDGAIARFLNKFGEGIQQVEIDVTDVDHATEILRTRFQIEPIYPVTRPGANGTRVNFFLVTSWNGSKVLVELVEQPKIVSRSDFTSHEKS